ncbi:dTDP-4-dehydrorhamnose reductase [Limobrevibacterium gyesilva]|uniref:dTDP-4-dehydrorhamnose reductase n=1 Tax=Limobrevibacterium gyesilva TaxID=2991712 RepID=A0AA41YJZ3_9PROT|nr:dTDP-4-dehydrorhamnose reductase [Limobrevibacterium gyesilva]MCW3473527.1 dTDP-4-dehydrorhamnose reductase [Limobrevibacterium gyesilva]
MKPGLILVTGGRGQLACALEEAAGTRPLRRVGRPDWDFDRPDALPALLRAAAPALIVNAAAYTAVDKAESDAAAALRANRDGPRILAEYCAQAGIPLIQVSTDYVFDGLKGAPYTETDPTNPTGVYGASKLAGEQAVLASGARAIVLRTSWVYAASGKNFVLTMLNAAARTDRLRVVADQLGCPTAAQDLAAAILAIADRIAEGGWRNEYAGVFHAAGGGSTSWHGLAHAIFTQAARHGGPMPAVDPIATADWPTPARRPPDSRLNCNKLQQVFGLQLPDWQDALARTIDRVFFAPAPASSSRVPV